MAFVQRLIKVTVSLADNPQTNQPNTFAATGTSTVDLTGSRAQVRIENSGNPNSCQAEVKIWGLQPSIMNQLATLGLVWNLIPRNTIAIQAGDSQSGLATIFAGYILAAYGDYEAQPDVPYVLSCNLTGSNAAITVAPTSYPQPFSVATAMASIANAMGAGFQNSGNVNITLPPMYIRGSLREQAQKIADAANIYWGFPSGNVLEIWTKTGSRTTPSIPVVSPAGGMISYPAFTQNGIMVKTLFDPLLSVGSLFKVQSSLLSAIANAQPLQPNFASPTSPAQPFPTQWAIVKLDLALDTMLPNGEWCSIVTGYNPGAAGVLVPPQ